MMDMCIGTADYTRALGIAVQSITPFLIVSAVPTEFSDVAENSPNINSENQLEH